MCMCTLWLSIHIWIVGQCGGSLNIVFHLSFLFFRGMLNIPAVNLCIIIVNCHSGDTIVDNHVDLKKKCIVTRLLLSLALSLRFINLQFCSWNIKIQIQIHSKWHKVTVSTAFPLPLQWELTKSYTFEPTNPNKKYRTNQYKRKK